MNTKLELIQRIAEGEYSSIVKHCLTMGYKLRIILSDKSFIDVNISSKLEDKFGFHWETKNTLNEIYRVDNFPDIKWGHLNSFPFHFHVKKQNNVEEYPFSKDIIIAFRKFMDFIKKKISSADVSSF